MKSYALLVTLAVLLAFPATASARPPYDQARSMTLDRAWRHCYAWYPLDPFSQRCSSVWIVTGYTRATQACRYFMFVTERNNMGRVLRVRVKSCDNSSGGFSTWVYAIDGFFG